MSKEIYTVTFTVDRKTSKIGIRVDDGVRFSVTERDQSGSPETALTRAIHYYLYHLDAYGLEAFLDQSNGGETLKDTR